MKGTFKEILYVLVFTFFVSGIAFLIGGMPQLDLEKTVVACGSEVRLPVDTMIISVDEAFQKHREGMSIFIDIREEKDFMNGHVAGAKHLSLEKMMQKGRDKLKEEFKGSNIVLYGDSSEENKECKAIVNEVFQLGDANVFIMNEGFSEWAEKGYPAEGGPCEECHDE